MSKQLPKVGDTLANGATVLKVKKWSDHPGDWYLGVVLCSWGAEFPTWIYNVDCGGSVEGHYNQSLESGLVDFEKRGARND